MRTRHVYLALCVLGVLLPYSQLIPWVAQNGLSPRLFVDDLFANGVSGFFGMDVIVSAVAVCFFAYTEGRRLGLHRLWIPVIAVFAVGVSLGLPLFLYLRQTHLERTGV